MSPASNRPLKKAIAGAGALLLAALGVLRAVDLDRRREQRLVAAEENAQNMALIVAEYLRGAFQTADSALYHLAVHSRSIGGPTAPAEAWAPMLHSLTESLPGIGSLSVVDTEGMIRHSTIRQLVGQSRKTDYLYQQFSKDPRDVLVVSTPFVSVFNKKLIVIPIGRPLTRADGSFDGLLGATILPSKLNRFFATVGASAHATLWIFHPNGVVLLRQPSSESGAIGEDASDNLIFQAVRSSSVAGAWRGSLTEGSPRLVAGLRHTTAPEIFVAVSLEEQHVLETWRHDVWISIAAFLLLALVFIGASSIIFRQLEARSRAEAALARAQRLEAIGQLTGGVAHDFNNLLTVILGNVDLLRLDAESAPADAIESLDEIEKSAKRAAEMTRRLLTFARRQPLQPQLIDLSELVRGVKPMLDRLLPEGVTLKLKLGEEPCVANVDPVQTETAVVNLCVNARDAMPNGGLLVIETGKVELDENYAKLHEGVTPGPYTMISVSDTGTGIPPEVLPRLFEPFFTTKEVGRGTGLGLSIVYGFVKQSRGHIEVYSEVDRGTSFKLFFPHAEGEVVRKSEIKLGDEIRGRGELVLLVEDEEGVRHLAKRTLLALGYRVLVASDGLAARDLARREGPIDLLFTDVMLPRGMNGRRLAEELTAAQPTLPVLFASGYAEDILADQGHVAEGVRLLTKPYSTEQLARAIRAALDAPRPELTA